MVFIFNLYVIFINFLRVFSKKGLLKLGESSDLCRQDQGFVRKMNDSNAIQDLLLINSLKYVVNYKTRHDCLNTNKILLGQYHLQSYNNYIAFKSQKLKQRSDCVNCIHFLTRLNLIFHIHLYPMVKNNCLNFSKL